MHASAAGLPAEVEAVIAEAVEAFCSTSPVVVPECWEELCDEIPSEPERGTIPATRLVSSALPAATVRYATLPVVSLLAVDNSFWLRVHRVCALVRYYLFGGDFDVVEANASRIIKYRKSEMRYSHPHPEGAGWRAGFRAGVKYWQGKHASTMYSIVEAGSYGAAVIVDPGCTGYQATAEPALLPVNAVLCVVDGENDLDFDVAMSAGLRVFSFVFNPTAPAGKTSEFTWGPTSNGFVNHVAGGSAYNKKAYPVLSDYYRTTQYLGWSRAFRVDEVRLSETHVVRTYSPRGWHWMSQLPEFVPYTSDVRACGSSTYVPCGLGMVAAIPTSLFDACLVRAKESKEPRLADFEAVLRQKVEGVDSYVASTALWVLTKRTQAVSVGYTLPVSDCQVESSAPGQLHINAPAPFAFLPDRNESNDAAAVLQRHQAVANVVVPSEEYHGFAKEFVERVVRGRTANPITLADVRAHQVRPVQIQRNLANSDKAPQACTVAAFQKLEAYTEPKDPRNISAVAVRHNLELSRYTYPFKEVVLKSEHWYSPGSSAAQLADQVVSFCRASDLLIETDFSRFDGTISTWLRRNVEFPPYVAAFGDSILELLEQEINPVCHTASGHRYQPNGSRLSGSPLTTDGNTLIGAFVDYCGHRKIGCTPGDAYRRIGLHFGDDGLSTGSVDALEGVARDLGLRLKCISRHEGVGYLGRWFPRPRVSRASMQDPGRTWIRISAHTNDSHPKSDVALARTLQGYLVTDAMTPVFGLYCRRFLELAKCRLPKKPDLGFIGNTMGPWPQDGTLTLADYSSASGVSMEQLKTVISKIESAGSLSDLRGIWPCERPDVAGFINGLSSIAPIRLVRRTRNKLLTLDQEDASDRRNRRESVTRPKRAAPPQAPEGPAQPAGPQTSTPPA